MRGEIIDGELYAFPRPRAVHSNVESEIASELRGPYQKGRGGPGGWWILMETGIELPRAPEFSPDLAGWRRERMPTLPIDSAIGTVPDWICEVLSPTTRGYDLVVKRRFYAEIGVRHLWYVDIEARALTVSRLGDGKWIEIAVHGQGERIRAEPFDAIELDLAPLWDAGQEPK